MAKDVCGDCKFFETEACDLRKSGVKANSKACDGFYRRRDGKKEKKRKVYKDSGLSENGCYEAIYHNKAPAFLMLNGEQFTITETLEQNESVFRPKDEKRIPYEPYGFWNGTILNREDLYWKVRREFQRFIDVEPIWLEVLSSCVLLSYQQEKLLTVPYIYLYGDNESGKSTVLQLLKCLCYRPMYGVTVPSADIYGYLSDSNSIPTILEDEIQGVEKDIDKTKIYKAGYKAGAVVPRTLITQHDRIIKFYNTFCFKACASERIPSVKGFRERFIEISMVEGFPEQEWVDVTKEDLKCLRDLRNILLKWRMVSKAWELPNPEVQMRGRLKELWKPILQITHGLTIYNTLAGFVEEQRDERISSKQNTLEGHIVKVVSELYDGQPIPFVKIWDELVSELDGKLDDKKPHVMDTADFFQVTKSKVGYRLREVLAGKSKKMRWGDGSTRGYEFNQEKLKRITKKYGFTLVPKFPRIPSSEGVQAPNSTLKHHENNVEKSVHAPLEVGNLGNSGTQPKSIDDMFLGKPESLTIQETLVLLRSSWTRGYTEDFDSLIVKTRGCSLEEAESLREKLLDEGVVAYDSEGFLTWVR